MEILAPAGAEEQLIAAVRSGADAVYLGTKNFNARSSAGNFDKAALKEAVSYCHARGVKVHVTLNTLVNDAELYDMLEDPGETVNCIGNPELADVAAEMKLQLEEWFARYADPHCDGRNSLTLTGSGQKDFCWKEDAFTHWNKMYHTGQDLLDVTP